MANKKVSQLTSKPSVLTTDLFPIADPSTGQLYKTTISDLGTAIGSGVSSVNSLVGAVVLDTDDIQELVSPTNKWFTDTRARAALSASSPLTYNSGTGAFGIQVATGSQNGYLSSADWTTFNAKQAALSGTGFVKISGTTISYDNSTYLTTSAAASTYLALAGGTMTGVLFGASASFSGYVGFGGNTSPLYQVDVDGSGRFSGDLRIESTNPRIYLTDTDNNPDYFISNTDGTFTVYDVTNSASRLTISTSQIQPRLPIVSNSTIQGTAFYSDSFFSATTFVTANNYFLTGMTSGSGALYYSSGSNRITVANYNASGIVSFEVNGGSTALTLNSNLSATFASTLSATGATLTGALSGTSATFTGTSASPILTLANSSGGTKADFTITENTGLIINSYESASGRSIDFKVAGTSALTIASTGAATFSSSVTASGGLNAGDSKFFNSIQLTDSLGGTCQGFLWTDAANTLKIGTGTVNSGNVKMTINSSGNVGIGTTSPTSGKLEVQTSATTAGLWVQTGGTTGSYIIADFRTGTNAPALQVIGSGYTLANGLRLNGSDTANTIYNANSNMAITAEAGYNISIGRSSDTTKALNVNTTNGNIGVGLTGASYKLQVSGDIYSNQYRINDTGGGFVTLEMENSARWRINYLGRFSGYGAGALTTDASGNITAASDRTLKDIIRPVENVLENIMDFEPVYFKWNDKTDLDKENVYMSTIAQSIQKHYPDAIGKMADGTLTVQDRAVTAILVQAIKELKAELDTLKNK